MEGLTAAIVALAAKDHSVTISKGAVQVDNYPPEINVTMPPVTTNIEKGAMQVNIPASAKTRSVTRDNEGRITGIVEE